MVVRAKEIMHTDVLTLPAELDALSGARTMVADRRGYAVILQSDRPIGIVTEWDYLEKIVANGRDASRVPLGDIASGPIVSCDKNTPTLEVVETMTRKGIRRMLVTDGGRVVGALTARDVIGIFRAYVDKVSADISRLQSSLI
jgi:CBS domain-containing protein